MKLGFGVTKSRGTTVQNYQGWCTEQERRRLPYLPILHWDARCVFMLLLLKKSAFYVKLLIPLDVHFSVLGDSCGWQNSKDSPEI